MRRTVTTPMATVLAALAALALLVPCGAVASEGGFSAAAVAMASADAQGPLTALALEPRGWPGGFDLRAAHIGGSIDRVETAVTVSGFGVSPADESSVPVDLTNVTGATLLAKEDMRILVQPTAGARVSLQGADADVAAAPGAVRSYVPKASTTRPDIRMDTAGRLELAATTGTLVVEGDFRLILWQANATLRHAGGEDTLGTGHDSHPLSASVPAARTVAREAYLLVRNGTLTLSAASTLSFAPALDLRPAEGMVRLLDATGGTRLGGTAITLHGEDLDLAGPVTVSLVSRGDERLSTGIDGKPDRAAVDGEAVALRDRRGSTAAWVLVAAAACVLLTAAALLHRRAGLRDLKAIQALMADDRFGSALRKARSLARLHPGLRDDASIAQAVCLIKLKEAGMAREVLFSRRFGHRARPDQQFLLARLAAAEGRRVEAERHLVECLTHSPDHRAHALADPVLAPLVEAASRRPSDVGGYA